MKPIQKVFLIIAVLVLAFIIWQLFFNDGGILQSGYNAIADSINTTWQKITGGTGKILPSWGDAGVNTDGQNLNDANNNF